MFLASQSPSSFGWRAGQDAHIVPFVYRGTHNFPSGVARGTGPIFATALDILCDGRGFTMPDPNPSIGGCWGYSDRLKKAGTALSFHAFGLALDVAAPWNGWRADPPPPSAHRMPSNTGSLVRHLGIVWGGDFRGDKDWMHLELHMSPGEVREWQSPAEVAQAPIPGVGGTTVLPAFPLPAGSYFGPRSGPAASVSNQWQPKQARVIALAAAQKLLGVRADGLYGPLTAQATRDYQLTHGLEPDGLIGAATWQSLSK